MARDNCASDDAAHDERIRERAYRIWLEEGCPEGRADAHWDMASELVAIEENYRDTLKPNPAEQYEHSPTGEPVEPLEAVRNLGEFPTLTDQGEEVAFPDPGLLKEADEPPEKPGRRPAGQSAASKTPSKPSGPRASLEKTPPRKKPKK